MKQLTKILSLFLCLALFACNSNETNSGDSDNDLESQLANNTFIVSANNTIIVDLTSCGGSSAQPDSTASPANLSTDNMAYQNSSQTITITFTDTEFEVYIDGELAISGTWEATDEDTILIEDDEDSWEIEISTSGNTITLISIDADCNTETEPTQATEA